MSEATGVDADPAAGVVVLYATDEEDACAERQVNLTPGQSITFRSPWNINPTDGVGLTVFFLDRWPGHPKRGSYTLTITEAGERANSKQTRNGVARLEELLISGGRRHRSRFTTRSGCPAMPRRIAQRPLPANDDMQKIAQALQRGRLQ